VIFSFLWSSLLFFPLFPPFPTRAKIFLSTRKCQSLSQCILWIAYITSCIVVCPHNTYLSVPLLLMGGLFVETLPASDMPRPSRKMKMLPGTPALPGCLEAFHQSFTCLTEITPASEASPFSESSVIR
jgi:hypothetical protein